MDRGFEMRIISIHLIDENGLKIVTEKDNPFEKATKQELNILRDGINNILGDEDITADFYNEEYFEGNSQKSGLHDFDNRSKLYAEEHASDRIERLLLEEESRKQNKDGVYSNPTVKFRVSMLNRDEYNVLEIGCAFGHTVDVLRRMGYNAYGVDISEYAINKYKQNYKFVSNFKDFKLVDIPKHESKTFNFIYGFNLMEHIPEIDLRSFIENVRNNLSEGGLAFFTIDPVWGMDNSHVTIHSREWWDKIFLQHGFEVHKEGTEMFKSINGHVYRKI
jgi:2-polyprenyl-3-methyl-5-hydroxy-6-metoxy-1,4-benzoquinol methylase